MKLLDLLGLGIRARRGQILPSRVPEFQYTVLDLRMVLEPRGRLGAAWILDP